MQRHKGIIERRDFTSERVAHLEQVTIALRTLTAVEIRGIYNRLETVRDILSRLLDRADGKQV